MLAVAAASALAVAAPALAAWEAPVRASKGPLSARSPDVAVNPRGDAAAVWVRGTGRAAMIVSSIRPAGGAWSTPEAISRRGRPAIDPQVAIDEQGLIVVAWRQVVRTRTVRTERGRRKQAVYVTRTRERGASDVRWSAISTLSDDANKVGPPRLAIDDDGDAVIAWHWGTGTNPRAPGFVGQVQVTQRSSDGTWSGATRVSRSTLCAQVRLPRVSVGGAGHAIVWWQCDLPGDRSTALAVTRSPGEAFGSEIELPFRSAADVSANVVVSDTGRAAAVSAAADGSLRWWRGEVGSRLDLQMLPALSGTERSDLDAGAPRIAVNAAGDALTAWTDQFGRPRTAPIAADLGVGSPTSLGPATATTGGVRVAAADMTRRGVITWVADGRAQAAARAADGRIGVGETLSATGVPDGAAPAVAVDAGGTAAVFWTRRAGGRLVVERAAGPVS